MRSVIFLIPFFVSFYVGIFLDWLWQLELAFTQRWLTLEAEVKKGPVQGFGKKLSSILEFYFNEYVFSGFRIIYHLIKALGWNVFLTYSIKEYKLNFRSTHFRIWYFLSISYPRLLKMLRRNNSSSIVQCFSSLGIKNRQPIIHDNLVCVHLGS